MTCASTLAQADSLLLKNGQIVDPAQRSVRSGSLLIRGDRIESILEGAPDGFQGSVVDLAGHWVLPGLVDMHTHSFGNTAPVAGAPQFLGTARTAQFMLYCGVTAFVDLFSVETPFFQLRDRQRQEGPTSAEIFGAGPCLTATRGHCSEYGVPTRLIDSPEDARREVGELAVSRPDVVKLVYDNVPGRLPTIDLPTLKAAIEEARRHRIRTIIHVGTWQDVRDAVESGADAVTHTPAGLPPDDLAALLVERGTYWIPTLCVHSEISTLAEDTDRLRNPLLQAVVAPQLIQAYADREGYSPQSLRWIEGQKRTSEDRRAAVLQLSKAGVKILSGTDAGNLGVFQGFSLHRELILLSESGLSNWQALASATTLPGEFLGQPWGVSPGCLANLVVLSASPLESLENTQRIERVVLRGRLVDREALVR